MNALAEINLKAHAALRRELGPADYARFLQQFDTGHGDYTAERAGKLQEDASSFHARTVEAKLEGRLAVPPNAKVVPPL